MLMIFVWMVVYAIVVAASIILIGKPLDELGFKSLAKLLLDWQFLLGGILALCARFIFVIINNLASKHPTLSDAHLTVAALATMGSIVAILLANYFLLGEQLRAIQLVGVVLIISGIFFVFR